MWCCQIIEHGGLPQSKNYGPYINADGACHSGQDSAMEGAIAIDGFMQVMRTRSFSTGESAEEGGGGAMYWEEEMKVAGPHVGCGRREKVYQYGREKEEGTSRKVRQEIASTEAENARNCFVPLIL